VPEFGTELKKGYSHRGLCADHADIPRMDDAGRQEMPVEVAGMREGEQAVL
jgi:hypothetical protein